VSTGASAREGRVVRGAPKRRFSLVTPLVAVTEGRYWAYLLIAPSLVLVGAVVVYPVIDGILLSFREYRLNRLALGTPWIGLEHYRDMVTDPIIRTALRNTLVWVTVGALSQFLLGLIAALALHRPLPGMAIARVLVLIPWLLPSVVSSNMWRLMLDSRLGVINDLLIRINILDSPRAWFTSPSTVLYEVLAVELWKNFAFFTLFLMAGLHAIPQELYDAPRASIEIGVLPLQFIGAPGWASTSVLPAFQQVLTGQATAEEAVDQMIADLEAEIG